MDNKYIPKFFAGDYVYYSNDVWKIESIQEIQGNMAYHLAAHDSLHKVMMCKEVDGYLRKA